MRTSLEAMKLVPEKNVLKKRARSLFWDVNTSSLNSIKLLINNISRWKIVRFEIGIPLHISNKLFFDYSDYMIDENKFCRNLHKSFVKRIFWTNVTGLV